MSPGMCACRDTDPACPRVLGVYRALRIDDDDDDVYYYIRWRLKLVGETENMGVCTKERREKVGFIENTAMRHRWGG